MVFSASVVKMSEGLLLVKKVGQDHERFSYWCFGFSGPRSLRGT